MNTLDAVNQNQNLLLKMLLESMLKPQELAKKLIAANARETLHTAKTESMGDLVDMYV